MKFYREKYVDTIKYYGLDISENGLEIASHICSLDRFELSTIQHDMRKNMNILESIEDKENSFIFSCFGLHYLEHLEVEEIVCWIKSGVVCGVDYEPLSNQYKSMRDPVYSAFIQKYYKQQGYTENIGIPFLRLQEEGVISARIDSNSCGHGLLPGWLISWRVVEND